MTRPRNYTDEVLDFIRRDYKGISNAEMAIRLEKEFGRKFEKKAVGKYRNLIGCPSGRKGAEGCVPHNKGKKGHCSPGCEKGWFKKGHMPKTHKPVGSERISVDGYYEIKVAEPRKWRLKHHVLWEQKYGPIPENHVVTFRDGNSLNCVVENLMLITKREHMVMNRFQFTVKDAELRAAGLQAAKLIIAIQDRKS